MTIVIPSIFKKKFDAYRRASGAYVAGRWADGAEIAFTVEGSSQPLSGSELNAQLLRMPEGDRRREMRKFYSDDVLRTVDAPGKLPADQITIDGKRFEVQTVNSHSANNNSHSKYILAAVNP